MPLWILKPNNCFFFETVRNLEPCCRRFAVFKWLNDSHDMEVVDESPFFHEAKAHFLNTQILPQHRLFLGVYKEFKWGNSGKTYRGFVFADERVGSKMHSHMDAQEKSDFYFTR